MNTEEIRQRLHNYLETADDKKIEAIYNMVEEDITAYEVVPDKDFKAELDKRVNAYRQNPSTAIDADESKRRIEEILKNGRT
jgi:putative addiction module component (TIGR02574 family)